MLGSVPVTRIDLTSYRVYLDVLLERLNDDSIFMMNRTDLVKLLIEQAMKNYCPDVVIEPNRKRYIRLEF